jgi:hypothetical protein
MDDETRQRIERMEDAFGQLTQALDGVREDVDNLELQEQQAITKIQDRLDYLKEGLRELDLAVAKTCHNLTTLTHHVNLIAKHLTDHLKETSHDLS